MEHNVQTKYNVIQYAAQKDDSKGVSAGMWGVERVRKEAVAFADDRAQALHIAEAFKKSDETAVKSADIGLW